VARKAIFNEDKRSGTCVLSRDLSIKNLVAKLAAQTLVQKCDDRGRNITVNLEFRKFSDNKLQEVRVSCENFVYYAKQVPKVKLN
jgi:hypothetical protein